jgi:hypothetical protein
MVIVQCPYQRGRESAAPWTPAAVAGPSALAVSLLLIGPRWLVLGRRVWGEDAGGRRGESMPVSSARRLISYQI